MARTSLFQVSLASLTGALLIGAMAYAPRVASAASTLGGGGPSVNPTLSPVNEQPIAPAAPRNAAAPVPSPSSTPSGPTYTTFTGTWEVALQTGRATTYTHFFFEDSDGNALRGRWLRDKAFTPISGEVDGDRFRLTGEDAGGAFSMTGYEEGTATMVGMLTQGAMRTPFTAVHRGESTLPGVKVHHRKGHKGKATQEPAAAAPPAASVPQGQIQPAAPLQQPLPQGQIPASAPKP